MKKSAKAKNSKDGGCKKKVAIFPGSFDPVTNGHINIINRGLEIFDKIIVAIAHNTQKKMLFTPAERVDMIKDVFVDESKVEVVTFEGLLVEYCKAHKINVIVRGLRTVMDFEFEFQVAQANRKMAPKIDTMFMMTESQFSHISSSILKEIVMLGGSAKGMIPSAIEKKMKNKMGV